MIFDPQGCGFDPATLACKGPKTASCLRPEQAAALAKGFAGPKDSRGNAVYPGFWFDTGIADTQGIPGLLNPGASPVGGPVTATQMDVDQDAMLADTANAALGDTAGWTQLNTFSGHGGKLIFFHGVSDPWFSAQETVRYYEQLARDNGGLEAVSGWSRLFLVPGMSHCSGGSAALDRFDLLEPLVSWVEQGRAPQAVVATGKAFPKRSRPLCAYPQHTHYKGSGDSQKAASFECRPPGAGHRTSRGRLREASHSVDPGAGGHDQRGGTPLICGVLRYREQSHDGDRHRPGLSIPQPSRCHYAGCPHGQGHSRLARRDQFSVPAQASWLDCGQPARGG